MNLPKLKPTIQPATYADIVALPPHLVGEILFGVLHTTFKDADPVTAHPFEVHTFPLDVLWVVDEVPPVD
jgi:hypothetical protein